MNFLNPPPSLSPSPSHTNHGSLFQLVSPSFYSMSISPPPSFLAVTAFDLGTNIKANPTRHSGVTCTQGGQGEVAFVPRGAASDPKDCAQCDKGEVGGWEGIPT